MAGFVINKLRGDPTLLLDGTEQLARATGVPTLGVLPYITDIALDAEDSLALLGEAPRPAIVTPTVLDVAAIRWPHLSNATDLDPLAIEPGVGVRWVDNAAALGRPDLVVLPGTKSTVADLAWLRVTGLDRALERTGAAVLGICGGYQVLGRTIRDPHGVEAPAGTEVGGLGWLDVDTTFSPEKTLGQRRGTSCEQPVTGYEIRHGDTLRVPGTAHWLMVEGKEEGARRSDRRLVLGTSLHGVLEGDGFRRALLSAFARHGRRRFTPATTCFATARSAQLDRLGDLVEKHLDLSAIEHLIEEAT